MKYSPGLVIFLLCMQSNLMAQNIEQYRWQNRIIVLLTESLESTALHDQLKELKSNKDGLEDRKIIVFAATPDSWDKGLEELIPIQGNELYNEFSSEKSFEYILIGLDGGIKLRKSTFVSNSELFGIVDSMPMRRNELKNKKNKN